MYCTGDLVAVSRSREVTGPWATPQPIKATKEEAIDFAIEKAEQEMLAAQAHGVELQDLKAYIMAGVE